MRVILFCFYRLNIVCVCRGVNCPIFFPLFVIEIDFSWKQKKKFDQWMMKIKNKCKPDDLLLLLLHAHTHIHRTKLNSTLTNTYFLKCKKQIFFYHYKLTLNYEQFFLLTFQCVRKVFFCFVPFHWSFTNCFISNPIFILHNYIII